MTGQLLRSNTTKVTAEEVTVIYNLIFKNAMYSIEGYIEGSEDKKNYCYIEDVTDDEGEAEAFLKQMVKGEVLPIHIEDMAEDYFGK